MADEHGIETRGLVRTFKDVKAVQGIDLRVEPGEIYGFLGPERRGQVDDDPHADDAAAADGGNGDRRGPRHRQGGAEGARVDRGRAPGGRARPVPDGARAPALPEPPARAPRADVRTRSEELLTRVGLTNAAERKVQTYSGGMKRRLDLALALVHRPRILFLDEPTTGLDPQSRSALWNEVGRLAKDEGVTVFLTTQYLEEADVLADRVGIIDHGKIVAEGTPNELKARDRPADRRGGAGRRVAARHG